ncbi:CBO0543 family protein [Niallia sp. FSL R7-0271]|uniref:CBO0543 family protein n=1 Tax=unclassified Niallia TaxID=2837522 RepID=UPI0030F6CB22
MKNELILIVSWVISIGLLLLLIPKKYLRVSIIAFLFSSTIAWAYEYIQVLFGLLEFPYREFAKATKLSFSLHYAVYPTFFVFFIVYYPTDKSTLRKFFHTFLFNLLLATYTFLLNKYSSLIEFKHWNFFLSVGINFFMLYIVRRFVFWFNKGLL